MEVLSPAKEMVSISPIFSYYIGKQILKTS